MKISYLTFFFSTLALLNPIGKIAVLLSLTRDSSDREIKSIVYSSSTAVFGILLLSLWLGADVLKVFDVSIGAFTVAGGLLVLLIGLNMVLTTLNPPADTSKKDTIAIVPLAIPLIAGPGAISSVILHSYHITAFYDRLILSGICFGMAFIVFICMYFAVPFSKALGEQGIKICTRLIGIISCALGVQMIGVGMILLFPILGHHPGS